MAPVLLAVSVISLPGVLAQNLTAVSLLDGTGRPGLSTGRIMATVVTTVGGTSITVTGTVCDPVNAATASFLCNHLGFVDSTRTGTVAQLNVPQGTGLIAIRNLDCSGAATLAACHFNILTAAVCTHSQDAALQCSVFAQTLTAISLLDGTGRPGISTGRIMVTVVTTKVSGTSITVTGTVCDPVNAATASFLCNHLGFVASTRTGTVAQLNVPQGTGHIAIRNLDCSGAATLAACHFNATTAAVCIHSQDAALQCSLTPGAVAGIVIGLLILLAILISVPIIIVCCCFGAPCCITPSKYRVRSGDSMSTTHIRLLS